MKILKRILLLIVLLALLGGIVFAGVGFFNYKSAINKESIEDKVSEIQGRSEYVSSEDISPYLLKATVSIEDHRFYDHNGVDYFAMLRALVSNIFAKGIVGGGSTITQQLAKNLYFDYQSTYLRKASEVFMAYDLEGKLSKEAILELYVNVINYGDNYIGIKAASEGYFGKEPKDLTLNEATLLAGLPQSPSNYQLSDHKENALKRQKQVLEAMVRDEEITEAQMELIVGK
ncbi:transglycosylase domain-containing protein [Amedibacillus sp. YH-ame10]